MISSRPTVVFFVLVSLFSAAPAIAQACDAYFQFDGDLTDASGNGYDGEMIAAGGEPSTPSFVEGRNGEALQLTGINAVRVPLDLHPDSCPQMTVTAWVRIEPEPNQMIFGNGGGNRLFNSVSGLSVRTTGADLWADGNPVRANGGWIFIASVWDYENEFHRLHSQGRSKEASFAGRAPLIPESAIWIGAENDLLHNNAKNMLIDEIRFIGRALSKDEVLALRRDGLNPASLTTSGEPEVGPEATLAEAFALSVACESDADCSVDSYCARERICHPADHLPLSDQNAGVIGEIVTVSESVPLDTNLLSSIRGPTVAGAGSQGSAAESPASAGIADPSTQAVIFGKVTNDEGEPIDDVPVRVTRAANGHFITESRTDASGNYAVAVFATEDVIVRPSLFAFEKFPYDMQRSSASARVKLTAGTQVEVNWEAGVAPCTIAGIVRHVSGLRLPGVRVSLFAPEDFNPVRPAGGLRTATTNENGEFEFTFESVSDWRAVEPAWVEYQDWGGTRQGVRIRVHPRDPTSTYEYSGPAVFFGDNPYACWADLGLRSLELEME